QSKQTKNGRRPHSTANRLYVRQIRSIRSWNLLGTTHVTVHHKLTIS
ncbi:leucine--tRNA ligase, partial [Vibrio parahaemolyticus 861]